MVARGRCGRSTMPCRPPRAHRHRRWNYPASLAPGGRYRLAPRDNVGVGRAPAMKGIRKVELVSQRRRRSLLLLHVGLRATTRRESTSTTIPKLGSSRQLLVRAVEQIDVQHEPVIQPEPRPPSAQRQHRVRPHHQLVARDSRASVSLPGGAQLLHDRPVRRKHLRQPDALRPVHRRHQRNTNRFHGSATSSGSAST